MQEADEKPRAEPEVMLNYNQYYPTQLPLRQPGMEETEAEAHAQDDRPPDLSLHMVGVPAISQPHTLVAYLYDPASKPMLGLPSVMSCAGGLDVMVVTATLCVHLKHPTNVCRHLVCESHVQAKEQT